MSTTRCAFQFTRPRGARQTPAACLADRRVSIHAPTGGATVRIHRPGGLQIVSIHAPTGGATVSGGRLAGSGCFNSRAHGGRDVRFQFVDDMVGVSIHAPTGGATISPAKSIRQTKFQFTRPRGARHMDGWETGEWEEFQFTRPRGARPAEPRRCQRTAGRFNSRAHGGRDVYIPFHSGYNQCFNSRAHGGRDPPGAIRRRYRARFNSRAHGGRDTEPAPKPTPAKFQFTRPRGARLGVADL